MRFVDLLRENVVLRREEILRILRMPEDRVSLYRDMLSRWWRPLPTPSPSDSRVYAVDSSDCVVELAGGGVLHIARAAALSNKRGEIRRLDLHAFYPPSDRELTEYRRLVREHLEHEAALEAVKGLGRGDAVLVDGTIFGRMTHVLRVLRIRGREGFMAEYVETLYRLLKLCLKRGVVLVGVAKDSRSAMLRRVLLLELLRSRMGGLWLEVAPRVRELLRSLRRPGRALRMARTISAEFPSDAQWVLWELLERTPDYKMLMSVGAGPGYSHPLKLELVRVSSGFIEAVLEPRRRAELAEKYASRLPEEGWVGRILEVLERVADYPPVAAMYVRFAENDLPLRVDILHPEVEGWEADELTGFAGGGWEQVVVPVLKLLGDLYAGLKEYNVLLMHADRYVRMTRRVREQYKSTIERLLNMLVQQSRGARRVSFP